MSFLCGNEFRVIRLEHNHHLGVFATANQVLAQLYLFETGQLPGVVGLAVDFDRFGLYYDPNRGLNWWTYYFEPICLGEREQGKISYPTQEQYLAAWQERRKLSRATAAHIVKKYIRIAPHIQRKIDAFAAEFFLGNYMIGIHYRGTDKKAEAPRVSYDTIFTEIDAHIPQDRPYSIFIATDEIEFFQQATSRYGHQVVAIKAHRGSSGGLGVHFLNKNNYLLEEEALMDACLLSKCNVLIRTSSSLSLWSTYFNPDLPTTLLNRRHDGSTLEPE